MESSTQHPTTRDTHMSKETSGDGKSDARQREHARRNAHQEEILFPAYRRVMHRAHVEAQLGGPPRTLRTPQLQGVGMSDATGSLAGPQRTRR